MFSKKISINFLYFFFLFIGLVFLHVYHVLLIDSGTLLERIYFMIQAISQAFLEVMAAMILVNLLPKRFMPWCVVGIALLFVARIVDFPLVRLMELSIWDAFAFISTDHIYNFVEQLYASNISIGIWITGGLVAFALVEIGVLAYYLTEKHAKKWHTTLGKFFKWFTATAVLLLLMEIGGLFMITGITYDAYAKALPWKRGVFQRDGTLLTIPISLKEDQVAAEVKAPALTKKPDIYLFVAESLREDYITDQTAPNLSRFRNENIALDLSLSNANATPLSWFSIFHSRFPLYWSSNNPRGSLPLKIFKELGYKVHVYTSARLCFFRLDEIIFGDATQLADSIYTFYREEGEPPWERDERTVNQLCEDLKKGEEGGRLFIVFLDATHFDYSWPNSVTRFHPFEEQINYLWLAFFKGDLEPIKNRYRNALSYVDTLFGRVMQELEERQESIVVFTGDHGEEFYESGHLFHASALSFEQTRIPLYYKINKDPVSRMTSHIDIFPSILHYLVGDDRYSALLDGQSIFSENRWPYLITTRYNAGRTPYEFMIHNGKNRLLARFSNESAIFKSDAIRILSVEDVEEKHIAQEFGEAFDRLFSTR